MHVSTFRNAKDNVPASMELNWDGLKALLGTRHRMLPNAQKHEAPAFSPAEWPEGEPRAKATVVRIWLAVADLDKLTQAEMDLVITAVDDGKVSYVMYTTWSHKERHEKNGTWSARLVLPLTRPVEAAEWPRFWPRFNAFLCGLCDPKCKDPSRIYFLPSAPSADPINVVETFDGVPLDVDGLLAAPEPAQPAVGANQAVGCDDLKDLASRLVRKASHSAKGAGHAIRHAVKGEPFAAEGARDETMFRVACTIIEEWPGCDPKAVAKLFEPSLTIMAAKAPDCPTLEDFEDKLVRRQENLAEEQATKKQARADALATRIGASFGDGRVDPYSEDELDRFAKDAGCTREDFVRRWVIQAGRSYYIFHDGQYRRAVVKEELLPAAERSLAPAHVAGVSIWRRNDDGELKAKLPQDLVLEYGEVAERVVVDLAAQRSSYDARTMTLTEAPCPLRDLESKFDEGVDEWLESLGGFQAELLFDWLASAPVLAEPCAAIYLEGGPGVGKTLLADAVARLWTVDGPTPIKQVVSDFNEGVLKCPLILADECMPKILKDADGTGDLRQLIQARGMEVNRKFKSLATLRGSTRIVLAANNRHMLDSSEVLTPEDIAAISERILFIHAKPVARKVLDGFGHEAVRRFVKEDLVAKHVLWLRDNRVVQRSHRFLVSGVDSALHRSLTTSRGISSAVCHWCVSYLLSPEKMDAHHDLLVRVKDGRLLVTARALAENWDSYKTNYKAPAQGRISRAISGLSDAKRQMVAGNGRATNYWPVKTENLLTWNEEMGYCTDEEISDALKYDTELAEVGGNVVGMRK